MKAEKEDVREAFEKLEREFVERDVDDRLKDYSEQYRSQTKKQEAEEDDRES